MRADTENYKKGKLTASIMSLTIVPLFLFGLIVLIVTSGIIYQGLRTEVKYSLNVLVHSAYETFDARYPGEFVISERGVLRKGGVSLEDRFEIVDNIKEMSGADATFFLRDARYLTTIRDGSGNRIVGTLAHEDVVKTVLGRGEEYFSDRVLVNESKYFGYYMPVRNDGGTIVGMAFAGKPRADVLREIGRNIFFVCLAAFGIMLAAVGLSSWFGRKLIFSLNKTEHFLSRVAQGDLTAQLDPALLERQDEIGEMGRFSVMMRDSIVELVGKDPLTGLANRRSCDEVLESLAAQNARQGEIFSIAMGDIDFFKQVNDTYGHTAGDEILKTIADYIASQMEHLGFVFRWGGEEFLLIYEDMGRETAYIHLRRLMEGLAARSVSRDGTEVKVTMTFGLADSMEESRIGQLVELADAKLYQGKREGRNRIKF